MRRLNPFSPIHAKLSSDRTAATHTGGCGLWVGAGSEGMSW
jgi:hypothetical protein